DAWEEVGTYGLTSNWDRTHVFHKDLGGRAIRSNLIAVPRTVNRGTRDNFETPMIGYLAARKVLWMAARVEFYGGDQDEYVKAVSVLGGVMKYENDIWAVPSQEEPGFPNKRFSADNIKKPYEDVTPVAVNKLPRSQKPRKMAIRGSSITQDFATLI